MSSNPPLAFEQITDQFNWVRRLAVDLCGEDRADDVAQETMFRALDSGAKHDRNLRGWLATIARNVVAGDARKEGRRREILNERLADIPLDESPEAAAEEVLARSEAKSLVADCVDQLPREYRVAALMHYQEDLSYAEIAVALEATEKTIRHRISRAQDKIRDMLRQRHGDHYLLPAAALVPRSAFLKPQPIAPLSSGSSLSGPAIWTAAALAIVSISAFVLKGPTGFSVFGAENAPTFTSASLPLDLVEEAPLEGMRTLSAAQPIESEEVDRSTWVSRDFVVKDELGNPITGADVVATKAGYYPLHAYDFDPAALDARVGESLIDLATSDANGNVSLLAPPNSDYMISIRKHGYLWDPEAAVHVADEGRTELLVRAAAQITLRILDQHNKPVADASAHIFQFNERSEKYKHPIGALSSDREGLVHVGHIIGPTLLHVFAPGHVHEVIEINDLQAGEHSHQTIELRQGNSLEGRILDQFGSPVANAQIRIVPDSEHMKGWAVFPSLRTPDAITGEYGEFQVETIPLDGNATVRVLLRGVAATDLQVDEIPLNGEIVLQMPQTLELQVLTKSDAVRQAAVVVRDTNGNSETVSTDSNGRAQITGLATGALSVSVNSPLGSIATQIEFGPSTSEPIQLQLMKEHELLINVFDEDSQPIAQAGLQLVRKVALGSSGFFSKTTTVKLTSDANGHARCFVQPGEYQIVVQQDGEDVDLRDVTVGMVASQQVDIRVTERESLRFSLASKFKNPDGAVLHFVPVVDLSLSDVWAAVDASGNSSKVEFAPGHYQVFLYSRKPIGLTLPSVDLGTIQIGRDQPDLIELEYDQRTLVDTVLNIEAPASFGDLDRVEVRAISEEQRGQFLQGKFAGSKSYRAKLRSLPVVGWPAGWYRVSLPGIDGARGAQRDVLLQPGQSEVTIRFSETPLRGRLHSDWLKQIGENSAIQLSTASGTLIESLQLGADGSFECAHLVAGQYVLSSRDSSLKYTFTLGPQQEGARDLGVIAAN